MSGRATNDEDTSPHGPLGHSHGHAHGPGGHSHGHSHGVIEATGSPGHGVPSYLGFVEDVTAAHANRATLAPGDGQNRVLFLDCPSGIAGDMTIAALLDLGLPRSIVDEAIAALGLPDVELVIRRGYAGALGATHFDVRVRGSSGERSYAEIVELIDRAQLESGVKTLAQRIFRRLAEAEAEVHRSSLEQVHFHEVGAVDAIVDVVGAAALFDALGARVVASSVPLGRGFVTCRHGVLPLPAPAALLCLRGVPTVPSELEAELVTPTGAAILGTMAEEFVEWPSLTPLGVGYGAGTRGLPDRPNVLRAVLGEERGRVRPTGRVALLEANVDDTNGEVAAFAIERLFAAGALDAWVTPTTMKKGRPGLVFGVLGALERAAELADCLFRETTTIGVRQQVVERYELSRRVETIETEWGPVRVKSSGDPITTRKIEFEDAARIARETGRSLRATLALLEDLLETRTG